MKKLLLSIFAIISCMSVSAQTLHVETGNITYLIPADQAGEMIYSENGTLFTVMGKALAINDISSLYITDTPVTDNTVTVQYNDNEANVTVAGNIAQYINATVSGAHVSIVQNAEVSETTCGEITYILSGASNDGEFYMEGSYKSSIELNGLELTNAAGAPINIQNGKRISISIKSGTTNTLTDCAGGSQKGCLVCKGHMELKGKGILEVQGLTSHAIYAKEYITIKNCTINVTQSVKDGINCNQYFAMESGELNISGAGDDGIQVSFKDDVDREAEDSGSITIAGGILNVAVTATAAKAIKADGDITITGGSINASTSGGGKWAEADLKTKASTCMSADGTVHISDGTLALTSTGSGGKGISCDADLIIDGGNITVTTSGGMFAYVNGTTYDNYTGNTDYIDSNYKSSPKGMKADGNVTINGGNIHVTTSGTGGEGIESKAIMTVNDGTIVVNSYDDGLNSSSHMYINGGDITVVATNNDGLDSNGNMYIAGGYIRSFGASAPECGIDANEEDGYTVIITGGTVIGVGGGNNSEPSTSESTQAYITGSGTASAGSIITISNGTETLATFTVPDNYNASSGGSNRPFSANAPGGWGGNSGGILISCPGLISGNSYTLTLGSGSSSVTAKLTGSNGGWGGNPW